METKTKEEQYIVPEDIVCDLKNELDVDYSLSGMRNAMHRLNYTCKTMEPLHSNMQSVEDVLEWQHDMKRWFSRLKKDKIDVWCNDTTTLRHDIARRFGLWAPEGQRVFGSYFGNHTNRCNARASAHVAVSTKQQLVSRYVMTTNKKAHLYLTVTVVYTSEQMF